MGTDSGAVMGVDACPTGWVGVALRDGRFLWAGAADRLVDLLADAPHVTVVGIDMPLGLLESGRRRADVMAAELLGRHRPRVFPVPPRLVWEEPDYAAANQRSRELTGSGLSRQSWGLAYKLRQANECRDSGDARLHEVHPEVSFAAMNGGGPVVWSKKGWNGQAVRRSLLDAHGIRLPDDLGEAGRVPPDDLLDAAAAAWTAGRIAACTAVALPDPPEAAENGLPIAIWY